MTKSSIFKKKNLQRFWNNWTISDPLETMSTLFLSDSPLIIKWVRIRVRKSHTTGPERHVYVVTTTFSDVMTFRFIYRRAVPPRIDDVFTRYSFQRTRAGSFDDYFVIASFAIDLT